MLEICWKLFIAFMQQLISTIFLFNCTDYKTFTHVFQALKIPTIKYYCTKWYVAPKSCLEVVSPFYDEVLYLDYPTRGLHAKEGKALWKHAHVINMLTCILCYVSTTNLIQKHKVNHLSTISFTHSYSV